VVFKTEFPKWESLKNKSGKSVLFFEPETRPSTHQLSPPIHHNFTTKKPRSTTRFCQNPQQKRGSTTPPKNPQKRPSSGKVLAPSGEDDGGDHCVPVFELEGPGAAQPTQLSDYGERSMDVLKPSATKFSLENVASPNSLILWGFSRVLQGVKADRNYAWTDWRRMGDSNPR
jgi:hypothetical protein